MSAPKQTGPVFLYRLARADAARLQALVLHTLGGDGWSFGGASIWDAQVPAAPNLRPIEPLPAGVAPNVAGDFGHAFNPRVEVRWKRVDAHSYDVLVLAETDPAPQGLTRLEPDWRSDLAPHMVALQRQPPPGQPARPPLWGKYYYGPGRGVVCVRYTAVGEAT